MELDADEVEWNKGLEIGIHGGWRTMDLRESLILSASIEGIEGQRLKLTSFESDWTRKRSRLIKKDLK
jgi:hypothetical protein